MANIEDIKARIRALTAKTSDNGCTEAEAEAALRMVGVLLAKYNLSMDEVEAKKEGCIGVCIYSNAKQRHGVFYVITAIAKFTNCKTWFRRTPEGIEYYFFGQETDTIVAKYMFDIVDNAIKYEVSKFKLTSVYLRSKERKAASSSFIIGMAHRLNRRIMDMITQEDTRTGNALIVLKNQIVEEEFAKLEVSLKVKKTNQQIKNVNAYYEGQNAANNVSLNAGVTTSAKTETLLLS